MKRNRKLSIISILVFLLLFPICGCVHERIVNVIPDFPPFTPSRPVRPELLLVEDGVQLPSSVIANLILLQGYARELEEYAEGWEAYYEDIRNL